MAVDMEMLQALGEMIDGKLEPLRAEIIDLKQSQKQLEQKVYEGFERIEYSINALSKDVGRIEKRLNQHVAQPIH